MSCGNVEAKYQDISQKVKVLYEVVWLEPCLGGSSIFLRRCCFKKLKGGASSHAGEIGG